MAQLATAEDRAVARTLGILVPLIKEDFELAERAGMEYYRAAGEKLIEACEGHFDGVRSRKFFEWAADKFGKKRDQITIYMDAAAVSPRKPFKSLNEMRRAHGTRKDPIGPGSRIHREWTAPVDLVAQRAHDEAYRLARQESLNRQQEREAERKLALRLIDIGFKVLAKELHPDKLGGDRDAMARLNRVRDRLKECI